MSIARGGLACPTLFLLNQKSYFPAPYLGTLTADVGRPRQEDKEQNECNPRWITLGLVYLTWTTLFVSAGIHLEDRGNSLTQMLASPKRDQHQTEIIL
jgi:hypothetical protein